MHIFKNEQAKAQILSSYDHLLAQWDARIEERDIPTQYGITHVILCGKPDNPPFVLLHGAGCNSAMMWIYNAQELSRNFRLIAIDTMGGSGKSIPNENYNDTFDSIVWLDEVLAALQLPLVHLMGVSHGAYMAQYYASHRPSTVERLVCIGSTLPTPAQDKVAKKLLHVFIPQALFPTYGTVQKAARKLCSSGVRTLLENDDMMEHFYLLLKGYDAKAMRYHKFPTLTEREIASYTQKSTFFLGGDDVLMSCESTFADFDNHGIRYQLFDSMGHAVHYEIAPRINHEIIDFLTRRNPS